jgi:hypothetical protein
MVTEIDKRTDNLVSTWLPLPDAADRLGIDVNRVRQLVRERQLIAVRRNERNVLEVPEAFIEEGKVLKGLPGTLTLLADNGFADDEALRWLFTEDVSLPGSPVTALREHRGTEVKRRAQALGL